MTHFVSLDGVSQGPGSRTEDTSDGFSNGGWLVPHLDEVFVQRTSEWLDSRAIRDGNCRSMAVPGSATHCSPRASSTRCASSSHPS